MNLSADFHTLLPRLKHLREIADLLHGAQNTYCNYENGVHEMPLYFLIRLSRYYEVNLEYLLGLTDDPTPLPPSVRNNL